MTESLTAQADLFDQSVVDRLSELAEGPDDYVEVMDFRVVMEVSKLGVIDGETHEQTLGLREIEMVNLSYGRVFEMLADDGTFVFAEADHRGVEHGIDGWVGSTQKPEFTLESIELRGARS